MKTLGNKRGKKRLSVFLGVAKSRAFPSQKKARDFFGIKNLREL